MAANWQNVVMSFANKAFSLSNSPAAVSYTHLDVYKRQKEHSVFFDLKHMDALKNLVNSGSFSADSKIKSEASGNIRMDAVSYTHLDVYKRQLLYC